MDAAEPVWLDETEQQAWIAVAAMVVRLPGALDAQLQRDSGLTLFEYFVLSRLSMADGRALRMSELAAVANGSLSRLSNVTKRLEQRGWVRRCPDPGDGRFTIATLTGAGWDRVVQAAPGHVDLVRRLLIEGLTPDQLATITTVGREVDERLRGCPPSC